MNIPNGIGAALDEKRKQLKTRQRSWLGKTPHNSGRQHQLAEGQEDKICTGSFASLDNTGRLTRLAEGLRFAGVVSGVGSNPHPVGSIRIGTLWEPVTGLTSNTEKGVTIFADPDSQSLNLNTGVPVGKLANIEEFGGGLRGHIELKAT